MLFYNIFFPQLHKLILNLRFKAFLPCFRFFVGKSSRKMPAGTLLDSQEEMYHTETEGQDTVQFDGLNYGFPATRAYCMLSSCPHILCIHFAEVAQYPLPRATYLAFY